MSAVGTFERVAGVDVSHDSRAHPSLAGVEFGDKFNASTRIKEIFRPPTLDYSIHHIQTFIGEVSEPTLADARTNRLFCHA